MLDVPDSSRWSNRFTMPEPLHDGSKRLWRLSDELNTYIGNSAHICVTRLKRSSSGEVVRKSALTGVTFVHFALASMVCKVLKRFLSRSKAKSYTKNSVN